MRGVDDERGRFFGGSGGFGLVPGSGLECLGVAGSAWEWLGVAWAGAGAGVGCFTGDFLCWCLGA